MGHLVQKDTRRNASCSSAHARGAQPFPRALNANHAGADKDPWGPAHLRRVTLVQHVFPECDRPDHIQVPGDRRGRAGGVRGRWRDRHPCRDHEPRLSVERRCVRRTDPARGPVFGTRGRHVRLQRRRQSRFVAASRCHGDEQVAISQEAAPCRFTVSPLDDSASPAGERRAIGVAASSAQCSWSARSETDWLTIVRGSQGNGNGEVVYEAGPTTGPSRRGELTIAGQRVTVTQGGGCSVAVAPTAQTVGADGGSGCSP